MRNYSYGPKNYTGNAYYSLADSGITFTVKDQLRCGACYAFSAMTAVETAIGMQAPGSPSPMLSLQYGMDCTPRLPQKFAPTAHGGCNGGSPALVLERIISVGGHVPLHSNYAYSGIPGLCRYGSGCP